MDKQIDEKLESLQKYVPFIDYIVKLNSAKYVKFKDIKKWIVDKRRLPLSDLGKIEQCLITNYKNISILEDKQMPLEISKIFFNAYINLCSDDEEESDLSKPQQTEKPSTSRCNNKVLPKGKELIKPVSLTENNDSDDDIEIVSVSYAQKPKSKSELSYSEITHTTEITFKKFNKCDPPTPSKDFDDETGKLLKQIDNISQNDKAKSDSEYFQPNNYHVIHSDEEVEPETEQLFQRRPKKSESKEIAIKKRVEESKNLNDPTDTILLDSSDDEVSESIFQDTCEKTTKIQNSDRNKKHDQTESSSSVVNGGRTEIENLSHQEMFGFIRENILSLEFHQLQAICKQIEAVATSTDAPPMVSAKDDVLSKPLSNSNNRETSPPPPAPRIESSNSPDRLLKLFTDILEKTLQKTTQVSSIPNTFESPQIKNIQSMTSQEPQLNFFQNPLIAVPMQPMILPQDPTARIPRHPNMYNTGVHQSNPATGQTLLNPRDPRARSSLYQKSIKIIKDEMAKRNGIVMANQITAISPSMTISTEIPETISDGNTMIGYGTNTGGANTVNAENNLELFGTNTRNPNTVTSGKGLEAFVSNQTKTPNSNGGTRRKSAITYGEYKRRKSEEQQKQREEEKRRQEMIADNKNKEIILQKTPVTQKKDQLTPNEEAPIDAAIRRDKEEENITQTSEKIKEIDIKELEEKKRAELQSILYSTLQPYEDKIQKMWKQKKDQNFKVTENFQSESSGNDKNAVTISINKEFQQQATQNDISTEPQLEIEEVQKNKDKSKECRKDQDQRDRISNRMQRIFKEMECTFKGFDYKTNPIGAKRRSSVHARLIISEQLSSSQGSEIENGYEENGKRISSPKQAVPITANGNEKKRRLSLHSHSTDDSNVPGITIFPVRRSSIHARYAIANMLDSQSSMDSSDIVMPSRETSPSASSDNVSARGRNLSRRISSFDLDLNETIPVPKSKTVPQTIFKKEPRVVLRRLTAEEIKKYTKPTKPTLTKDNNILNVHLVESGVRSETPTNFPKKLPPKKCNNDCQMTERNTKFCALCSSKPSDLTNHYKRKHKCESYISRFTWSELDELCINPPFAKLVSNFNSRVERYEVDCPFCHEKLTLPFMQLYDHYASHTGEYAYQCAVCQLDKPFRADIQSHQLHSKMCRNAHIQTLYRYSPNALSIYLHYCTICNFVQLNEANVLKHLREHHQQGINTGANVKKCILAAISDGPESNTPEEMTNHNSSSKNQESDTNIEFPLPEPVVTKSEVDLIGDDNIPVCNEAFTDENLDLDELLREMHEELSVSNKSTYPQEPMTVLHLNDQSLNTNLELGRVLSKAPSRLVPKIIKMEAIDFGENSILTPSKPSSISNKSRSRYSLSYKTYRQYPANVNYLGFYKCMAGDCFYSTDKSEEFVSHLENHQKENCFDNILVCPYCIIPDESCQTPCQLVDHFRTQHTHLVYQCSLCCYRSCEASNVRIHQKEIHLNHLHHCKIYKCSGSASTPDLNYIKENMCETVQKVQCPNCQTSYYNTFCLMHHIKNIHKIEMEESIRRYSCIYCLFWDKELSAIRKHMALVHPGELPFLCNHNSSAVTEDSLHHLELTDLSEPVTCTEPEMELEQPNKSSKDIKPSVEELIRCLTETVKIRLRKLTEKTGIAPNYLYRCPESSCGGFFSIYDLWLRHMKVKHRCLEVNCPHCPEHTIKSLDQFESHFEEHRRHTYICLHCPITSSSSEKAEDHWSQVHTELGQLKIEQIRFNFNYSYYILTKTNQFPNNQEFLNFLSNVIDSRIKDHELKESCKLKYKWLVATGPSTLWLEDYPKYGLSPKLVKKCFNGNCNFRTKCDETLFTHVRTNHDIRGSIFKCSKCDFRLENSDGWDEALNHIKQHSETSFFICGACSKHFLCRSKISEHIRAEHAARDVPIINLKKDDFNVYARIAIVFANECLAFSTMHNCFCCEERNVKGYAFMLHLRRYHNFVLNYFCEWCNMPIDSLQSVQSHFNESHTTNKLKIRCELASKANLTILSVHELKIQINEAMEDRLSAVCVVKQEPTDANDDSVILVEDDDILAENYERTQKENEEKTNKPKLKCIATQSLVDANVQNPTSRKSFTNLRILPRIKIVRNHSSSNSNESFSITTCSTINPPSMLSTPNGSVACGTSTPTTFHNNHINTLQSPLQNVQINQGAHISPTFPLHPQINIQGERQSLQVPLSNPPMNYNSGIPTNIVQNSGMGITNVQIPLRNNVSITYLPTSGSHVVIPPAGCIGTQTSSSQINSFQQQVHSTHQPSHHVTITNISHSSNVSGVTVNPNFNVQLSAFGNY